MKKSKLNCGIIAQHFGVSVSRYEDLISMKENMETQTVAICDLIPHPKNYRKHPEDQLEHIIASIKEHGLYRNIVIARDNTILAGHGVVQALEQLGVEQVSVVRLDISPDDPAALKVLTGDNTISHLGEIDDRLLTELLKEIHDSDVSDLLGTGFTDAMLANLVFVTRPESEIDSYDAAASWVGLPGYVPEKKPRQVLVSFTSEKDVETFAELLGIEISPLCKATWFPFKAREDPSSIQWQGEEDSNDDLFSGEDDL